jgi:hypothetical protein
VKVSIKEGNRRLLLLARKLERLPPKRFSYNRWVGFNWKGRADLSCGTTACALGWATTMPVFRKLGLRLVSERYCGAYVQLGEPFPVSISPSIYAAMRLFALSEYAAEFLFVPSSAYYGRIGPPARARAATVAAHIRRFVASRS